MIALVRKDVMTLWKSMKVMLLMVVLFAVIPSDFQNRFGILYASLFPCTAHAYDERSKWNRMAAMLPYSKRDLVLSKYVLGWLGVAVATVLTLTLRLVSGQMGRGALPSAELLPTCLGALLIVSVMLPVMFRFGVEKGRIIMILMVMLVCGGAAGFSSLAVPSTELRFGASAYLLMVLVTLLASAASVRLSIRLYGKQSE